MQRIILSLLSLVFSSFLLTACGLKGPLYMPKDYAQASQLNGTSSQSAPSLSASLPEKSDR